MNASRGTAFPPLLLLLLPAAALASDSSFVQPEIVRVIYVEGDVRLSPGNSKAKDGAIGKSWVQAEAGIPIEQAYNLSTGAGKAEVEFEDGSVLYLADNSTLLFEELTVFDGAPSRSAASGSAPKPVLVATLNPRVSIPLGGAAWGHVVEPGGRGSVAARGSSGSSGGSAHGGGSGNRGAGRSGGRNASGSASGRTSGGSSAGRSGGGGSGGGGGRSSGGGGGYNGGGGSSDGGGGSSSARPK